MKNKTEAVEACPYCTETNVLPNYNVTQQGYAVHCEHCGKRMMLCDECLHADDNPGQKCDWHEKNGKGSCFRDSIPAANPRLKP